RGRPPRPVRRGRHFGDRSRGWRSRAGFLLGPQDAPDPRRKRDVSTQTADIGAAVAGQAHWMEDLLVALVQAPTELGHEEAGQVVIADAVRACGLSPRAIHLDADALGAHPNAAPFSW